MKKRLTWQGVKTVLFCMVLFLSNFLSLVFGFNYVSVGGTIAPTAWQDAVSLGYFILFWVFLLYAIFRWDYGIIRAYFYYSIYALVMFLLYPLFIDSVLGPFQPTFSVVERLIKLKSLGYGTENIDIYIPYTFYVVYGGMLFILVFTAVSFISFFHQRKRLRMRMRTPKP